MTSPLRSAQWFDPPGKAGAVARMALLQAGFGRDFLHGKPVIGIANSYSELTPCNGHFRWLADAVRRGVLMAGGLPLEFGVMSLGEPIMRPSTMLYRNLVSMEVEETIRANPVDGVVLLGGCDKTTPAALMGAISVDIPAIAVSGGPMATGHFRGGRIGSGTDLWRMSEQLRAGAISQDDFDEFEGCHSPGFGSCMTMGTASTVACVVEALGMSLPGGATTPALSAARLRHAEAAGARAVELVREDLRPSRILTRDAFANACVVNGAIGGSTNAILHLLALAGRAEVDFSMADFARWTDSVPLLVDLMPNGNHLMAEFDVAGGVPAVMHQVAGLLRGDAMTVSGRTVEENLTRFVTRPSEVIRPMDDPLLPAGSGTAVLTGSLAPGGAVIKQSAASPELLVHRGRAMVFDSNEAYLAVANDPHLDVDPSTVLVVRGAGPVGYPGMPEIGNLPMPRALLDRGVTDMVRISDARMSGTAYGTVVLHTAPEAAVGGPIAVLRTGDEISLDVPARRIDLLVDEAELARRSTQGRESSAPPGGYVGLYREHVMQADRGADFDFLVGRRGSAVPDRAF